MGFAADTVPLVTAAMKDAADAYAEAARAISELPVQSDEAKELLSQLRASADAATAQADLYAKILADDVAPAIGEAGGPASASSQAAGAIAGQKIVIAQASAVIDDMVATLDSAAGSLGKTQALLDSLVDEIDRVHTDAMMLAGSDVLKNLVGEDGFDAEKVAEFISAPTRLDTVQLYPVDTYGAAMAPLFMNLTFWIGAFMLMVVLRQEVDSSGIRKLTLTQRYLGRFLLYALLVILQAVVCCAGLPVIGMHGGQPAGAVLRVNRRCAVLSQHHLRAFGDLAASGQGHLHRPRLRADTGRDWPVPHRNDVPVLPSDLPTVSVHPRHQCDARGHLRLLRATLPA